MAEDFVMMRYRNPARNRYGTIDVELEHPEYGWIPFTASPDDNEEFGRVLYAEIEASKVEIAPYVPPTEEEVLAVKRAGMVVYRHQIKQELLAEGLLDAVKPAIDAIEDETARRMVQIYWDDAQVFERNNEWMILLCRDGLGLTDEQIDDIFDGAARR